MGTERRSPLFESEASRSNVLLARTFYNELVRSNRSRAEILDFVNVLLGLVTETAREAPARPRPLINPATGMPTRQAFHLLLLHELDPAASHPSPAAVLMVRFDPKADQAACAGAVRHSLRASDVIAPLGSGRIAAVVYPKLISDLPTLLERLARVLSSGERSGWFRSLAGKPLQPGTAPRALWAALLRQSVRSPGLRVVAGR